jgi:hypothetical protein
MNVRNVIGRNDRLTEAAFEPPTTIRLRFADDRLFSLDAGRLELPEDRVDWSTVAVAPTGESLTVTVGGETIPIEATTVRYLVDEAYAAEVEASIRRMQFTREELAQLARDNPPPPDWYTQPSQDLTRDCWKQSVP